jgi:hypothetical protein
VYGQAYDGDPEGDQYTGKKGKPNRAVKFLPELHTLFTSFFLVSYHRNC